jgi:predicted PurR-regulated permease PerM
MTRVRGWIVTAIFVLAVFYSLYVARDLLLPMVLALLFSFLLAPVVRVLRRFHVPRAMASALLVLTLLGAVGYAASGLSEPAAAWLQGSPQILRDLERRLRPITQKVEEVDKAAAQVEKITSGQRQQVLQLRGPSLREMALGRAQELLMGGLITFLLLYFLLASGDRLMKNAIAVVPTREGRKNVIKIARNVEHEISYYLGAIALLNSALGVMTGIAMYCFGMPNPVLWGVLATLLNFVPFLGPTTMALILGVVAVLTFDRLDHALLVVAAFLVLTAIEGQLITPTIVGRRLALNPVVLVLGLIFWSWLWGPAGALLAVPMIVTVKIVANHVPPLMLLGRILGP